MNLLKSNRVKKRQPVGGEQGWLNEVYLWEKFDIGIQYTVHICSTQYSIQYRYTIQREDWGGPEAGAAHLCEQRHHLPLRLAVQARRLPQAAPHADSLQPVETVQRKTTLATTII